MARETRVLVTGAGGFIGSRLCQCLLTEGLGVVGLDAHWHQERQASARRVLRRLPGFELVEADMVTTDLAPTLRNVEAVVHLAGSPGVQTSWAGGFDHHVRNNVVSTQRLFEAALDAPVSRIVVASSSSVYGNVEAGAADEGRPLRPLSPYGASKGSMELLAGAYVERGLSVVPLRFFTVFGPGQRPDMAISRMIDATEGGPRFTVRGDGTQRRSYTYIDDAVRAARLALGSTATMPINVGGGETVSVNDVIAEVESLTGREVVRSTVAELPGDPQRTSAENSRARRVLGWEPKVGLREGLAAQIEWRTATASIGRLAE